MDQNNQDKTSAVDKVLAFDTIFTNNHIKMLKVLLSYFDPAIQKTLAIYIKFLELNYTMEYFRRHPNCTRLPTFKTTPAFFHPDIPRQTRLRT